MPRRFALLLLGILLLKTSFLLIDSQPSFQFGDSASYLTTALSGWIPPDRSFVYGFLLRPLILTTHSLQPVIALQAMLSGIAAWILALCLTRYFHVSFTLSAACALACALEPLQLMFERFIMTETVATFGFALYFLLCLEYLESGRLWLLAMLAALSAFLVSVRFSFLPLVIVVSCVLPLLAPPERRFRPAILRLAFSVLATQALLYGYRHLYGALAHEPPAYLSRDGLFLLADVSPLIIPADFPDAAQRAQVFGHLTISPLLPQLRLRTRWLPGGLCNVIVQASNNDQLKANRLARATALHAIERDPLGLLQLGLYTYSEFFDPHELDYMLWVIQGQFVGPTPVEARMIQTATHTDPTHRRYDSLTKRWEAAAKPWYWLVLIAPPMLTLHVLFFRRLWTNRALFALLCSWIFLAGAVLPTELANPRYLLPLTWLTCLQLAALISTTLFRKRVSQRATALPGRRKASKTPTPISANPDARNAISPIKNSAGLFW